MSLKSRLIPCLDVNQGRVVKGVNFVELTDAGDPTRQAQIYDAAGADELCFLDITASHENRSIILDAVQQTAEKCFVPLTVGGGVRTVDDVRNLLLAGADKVSINSASVATPDLIDKAAALFGCQAIVVAIDAKWTGETFEVFVRGGRENTGLNAVTWAQEVADRGAGEILLTSVDRDGTKTGYDIPLTQAVSNVVPIPVIASGGVGTLDHLISGIREGGASAVLAASIFHFGTYTIAEAKAHMTAAGLKVRQP